LVAIDGRINPAGPVINGVGAAGGADLVHYTIQSQIL
jgi:hypothetical protein